MSKTKINHGSNNDEEVKSVPRVPEVVLKTISSELEEELANEEECEDREEECQGQIGGLYASKNHISMTFYVIVIIISYCIFNNQ